MTLYFETTHEYYLDDPGLYFCEDHDTLIIHDGNHEDRIVIRGIDTESVLKFASKIYKESMEKELKKDEKVYEEVKKADPVDLGLE